MSLERVRNHKLFMIVFLLTFVPGFAEVSSASEADLILPDLSQVAFQGVTGFNLLLFGLVICALGMVFGIVMYRQLKLLPVHHSCF